MRVARVATIMSLYPGSPPTGDGQPARHNVYTLFRRRTFAGTFPMRE